MALTKVYFIFSLNLYIFYLLVNITAGQNTIRPIYSFDVDKKCKLTNGTSEELSKCVTLLRDEIRPWMGAGVPEIGFKPLEPIHFKTFEFNEGTNGPIVIRTVFNDLNMWGLSSYTKWTIWIDRKAKTWTYDMFVPKMRLDGNYAMTGNVFIFPIGGNGTFYFNLKDFTLSGTNPIHIKINPKNGQKYLEVSKSRINMDIKHIHIYLDNLFNGNAILGPVINNYLNENVQELFGEIKPALEIQVGEVANYVINGLLNGVPSLAKYLEDDTVTTKIPSVIMTGNVTISAAANNNVTNNSLHVTKLINSTTVTTETATASTVSTVSKIV